MLPVRRLLGVAALALVASVSAGSPAALAAAPTCFGAAERDPVRPCTNPSLSVFPTLERRGQSLVSGCRETNQEPGPICAFGTRSAHPRRTIALIGDSHALHWRGPLAVVARAKRWRGLSVWLANCLFSKAVKYEDIGVRHRCVTWNRDVMKWFGDHPEVSTVFVSQATYLSITPPAGRTVLATKISGFIKTWAALPKTVKHIVVIRDVPGTSDATFDCIARVVAARAQRPGPACREDRRAVLHWDSAVAAALRTRAKRVQLADLTRFFCDPHFCFPVIGGVLVHRDLNHMTVAYAKTLGPYLLRAVRRLSASW
jgi:hypothetical protein